MQNRKWWDLAVGGGILVVALLVWWQEPTATGYRGAYAILAILAIYYFTLGRRAVPGRPASLVLQLVFLTGIAVGAWFSPNMLTLQVVALPMVWTCSSTTRRAVITTVIAVPVIMLGFALGLGGGPVVVLGAVLIGAITLIFSLAIGLWMTSLANYGNERARLLHELTETQSELELLNREAGAASERERLAREIHDTIAQSLTSVVMLAQRAERELRSDPALSARAAPSDALGRQTTAAGHPRRSATAVAAVDTARLEETITMIETMAREALGDARSLVATIAALPDQDASLADSLGRIGERFERETGVRVAVSVEAGPLPRAVEVVLLRCAQEALANVRKHARASQVSIRLGDSDAEVRLRVRDDGRGPVDYDPTREQGFGLSGMRDRLGLMGGTLQLVEAAGGGAELIVSVAKPTDEIAVS